MAGSFPDVPGHRIAYDDDGSVGFVNRYHSFSFSRATTWTQLSAGNLATLNNENIADGPALSSGQETSLGLIWPEPREIDGLYAAALYNTATGTDWFILASDDTTWMGDGTWDTLTAAGGASIELSTNYRDDITSYGENTRRGLEIHTGNGGSGGGNDLNSVHVYGEISPGETPDRLLYIDENTGLEFTDAYDYGDIPRGSSEDIEFRLKNNSASLTINTIQYTAEDLYLGSGDWYTFTTPAGSTFNATQSISSLASATTTGIITMRRITPGDEQTGLHAARIQTTHASLT